MPNDPPSVQEFLNVVRQSTIPLLDEIVARELGTSVGTLRESVEQWSVDGSLKDGEIFTGRISYHRAYAPSEAAFLSTLNQFQTELEDYVKRGLVFPSKYLREWFPRYYRAKHGVFVRWELVTAVTNHLVEQGRLCKLRRFDLSGNRSTSTYHPSRSAFIDGVILRCVGALSRGQRVSLESIEQMGARFDPGGGMGPGYNHRFWVYAITGYLEYGAIGILDDGVIHGPGTLL